MKILSVPINLKDISKSRELKIEFHSRFENTINFRLNNKIIAFQNKELPLTPYSIRVSRINDIFDKNFKEEYLKKILDKAEGYVDLKILFKTENKLAQFLNQLESFLKVQENTSDTLSVVLNQNKSNYFSKVINDNFFENFERAIGLGGGLTPAGDDFIIGYLLGLNLTQSNKLFIFKNKLKAALEIKDATNDISRQYLQAALDDYYNEHIVNLVKSLESKELTDKNLKNISAIGATSGMDLLAGLYRVLKEKEQN